MPSRLVRLGVVATACGAFSGLFGVGGGTVVVPLLLLWFAYGEREATGTSLLAIAIVAAFAAGVQALHGHLHVLEGVLIGLPAVAGVIAGTAVQQRVPERAVAGVFAALLIASAAALVV